MGLGVVMVKLLRGGWLVAGYGRGWEMEDWWLNGEEGKGLTFI